MHIGLIGGIGPAATEFYYRGLIDRHAAAGTTLDLTIAHADVREMSRNLANRDPQKQAEIFAMLVKRMAAAGAQAAAVTSMGGHPDPSCAESLFQSQFSNSYNVAFASYLMAMAPAIIVYLFTQRWVMEGVTQGAVKG